MLLGHLKITLLIPNGLCFTYGKFTDDPVQIIGSSVGSSDGTTDDQTITVFNLVLNFGHNRNPANG